MELYDQVKKMIKESDNIVFFGGAGVSTASGIPDFRSAAGLYNQKHDSDYSPEYMLSHEFFEEKPKEFAEYIKKNLIYEDISPNKAHKILASWEKEGRLKGIITQNIDSLHQLAGSRKVFELHGNLREYYCVSCGKKYTLEDFLKKENPPLCDKCESIIRADIVLYGEGLKQDVIEKSIELIQEADVLIVGGTSLVVYPAAGFLDYYNGNKMILINKEPTAKDAIADYVFYGDIGEVLASIAEGKEQ